MIFEAFENKKRKASPTCCAGIKIIHFRHKKIQFVQHMLPLLMFWGPRRVRNVRAVGIRDRQEGSEETKQLFGTLCHWTLHNDSTVKIDTAFIITLLTNLRCCWCSDLWDLTNIFAVDIHHPQLQIKWFSDFNFVTRNFYEFPREIFSRDRFLSSTSWVCENNAYRLP